MYVIYTIGKDPPTSHAEVFFYQSEVYTVVGQSGTSPGLTNRVRRC
jgi:hypothetical protein